MDEANFKSGDVAIPVDEAVGEVREGEVRVSVRMRWWRAEVR